MEGAVEHGAERSKTPAAVGREHQRTLLAWADRFGGWITTDLASHILRPDGGRGAADRAAKALVQRTAKMGYLLARKLPANEYRARHVYMLTHAGATLVDGRSGERMGHGDGAEWCPPKTFNHDLRTARFLVALAANGQDIRTGAECQRRYAPSDESADVKIPDGLFRIPAPNGGPWTWLETEAQNKSSKSMATLGLALYLIAADRPQRYELAEVPRGEAIKLSGVAILLPPPDRFDHRSVHADHRTRIRNAVKRARDKYGALPGANQIGIWVYTESESEPWLWHKERDIFTFNVFGDVRSQDEGWVRPPPPPATSEADGDAKEAIALEVDRFAFAQATLADVVGEPARKRGRLQRERDDARHQVKALKAELDAAVRKIRLLETQRHTAATHERQAQERLADARREITQLTARAEAAEKHLRNAQQLIDRFNAK